MTQPDDGEDFTEITDAVIPRIDLVGKGANGMPFLIAKNEAGIFPPDLVRDLIEKSEPRDDVTMSPSALMKMIHEAAQRATTTPPTAQEGAMTAAIVKDDPVDADPADIDLTDPLADSTDILAESMPGSAAWEQLDADSAMKWTAVLARAKNALEVLSNREQMEATSPLGDGDDMDNSWDLDDACCAIDFAIGTLAAYAVGEQATSEQMDEMASMQKAAAGIDTEQLAVLETYAPIVKAGRVLSAANEAAIRGAVESLSNVLNTLPAPIPDAAPVAKEQAVTEPVEPTEPEPAAVAKSNPAGPATAPTGVDSNAEKVAKMMDALGVDVAKSEPDEPVDEPVEKAKGDPLTPVYDSAGKLVGMVDATDLIPIAPAAPADAAPTDGAPVADDATPPDATVAAPQPPDAATIPGTATVVAPVDDTVAKGTDEKLDALIEAFTTVAKQSSENAALADVVKSLQDRLDVIAKMPDDRKSPRLNGGTGTPGIASRDGSEVDQFAELRKAAEEETDPVKKAANRNALFYAQLTDRITQHR